MARLRLHVTGPHPPGLVSVCCCSLLTTWTLAARLWSYLRTKMHCTMYILALVFSFRQSPLPPWLSIFLWIPVNAAWLGWVWSCREADTVDTALEEKYKIGIDIFTIKKHWLELFQYLDMLMISVSKWLLIILDVWLKPSLSHKLGKATTESF